MLCCIGYFSSNKKINLSKAKNNDVIKIWENKKIKSTVKVGSPQSVKHF